MAMTIAHAAWARYPVTATRGRFEVIGDFGGQCTSFRPSRNGGWNGGRWRGGRAPSGRCRSRRWRPGQTSEPGAIRDAPAEVSYLLRIPSGTVRAGGGGGGGGPRVGGRVGRLGGGGGGGVGAGAAGRRRRGVRTGGARAPRASCPACYFTIVVVL